MTSTDPQHPHRPTVGPVRPAALDALRATEPLRADEPPATVAAPSASAPARQATPRRRVSEDAHPCASCGYDLRGLPTGGLCPECGARIPKKRRVIPESKEALEIRFELSAGWRGLSLCSLAPIVLLTPLPYIPFIGPAIGTAAAFGPAFRRLTLRRFDLLPDSIGAGWTGELAQLRTFITVELVLAALVCLFAIAGTFALIPAEAAPAYFVILVLWWIVSLTTISQQLRAGHLLAARLVDPSVLPSVDRARLMSAIGRGLAVFGILALVASGLAVPAGRAQSAVSLGALACLLAAALAGGYACVIAYGHAPLVAECIHEAEALGAPRRRNPDDDDDANPLPPPAPIDPRDRKPGSWEDEERIPLA